MFKIRLFTLATCLTLGGVVLPALALDFNTPSTKSKSSLDRSDLNLNKTRPEFTQPDLRTPTPAVNPSPSPMPINNASPAATPNPALSPGVIPTTPANPLPVGGAQGLGDRPIIPTINPLPAANRREFQVPDLRLPGSTTPIPIPSPTPSPSP
jgi:hypothetical protein